MKSRTKVLSIVIFLSVLIILVSCQKQKTEWKGTIEEVDGVTVIKNPKEPMYGEDVFSLEEELSIGEAEGREEYLFYQIRGIAVDEDERIYVLDSREAHIKVFHKTGDYLKTMGRKGQGPGEMQMPIYVQITSKDEVMVHDTMAQRLSFFSLDGKYLRQKSTAKTRNFFTPIKMDSQDNLIVFTAGAPPPVGGRVLKTYDSNLELLTIVAEEERGTRGIFDIGKSSLYCAVSPSDNIVWGDSKEYVLHILNQEGNLIKRVIKEHNPIEITAEDKEKYEKQYAGPVKRGMRLNFRSHFPAFSEISVDDEERIFVKTYERVEGKEDLFYFDVFESGGKYIAKVPIQASLNRYSIWKKHKLYTIEEDEEGYQMVKRYKIAWRY
jgi:hypothetical protein